MNDPFAKTESYYEWLRSWNERIMKAASYEQALQLSRQRDSEYTQNIMSAFPGRDELKESGNDLMR